MNAVPLDVPGGDLEGIQYGVDYMKIANLGEPLTVGQDVVIVGGGYTAMDCSRTSLRYGAKNVTIAYRRACLNAIDYLKKFGYSGEQAYTILSTAPVEGRVSGVVDIPNACVSLYIPLAIFDFDIRPNSKGPQKMVKGGDLARAR